MNYYTTIPLNLISEYYRIIKIIAQKLENLFVVVYNSKADVLRRD